MIDRRTCLIGGGTVALGGALGFAAANQRNDDNRTWRTLDSGEYVEFNGVKYETECGPKRPAIQISKNEVMRFTLMPGNFWENDDPSDSERAEIDGWPTRLAYGRSIWSAWSMFYEPGPQSTSDWCILHQIYHLNGYPMPHVLKPNGDLLWIGMGGVQSYSKATRHRQKIKQGEWLHFVENYRFDPVGDGYWKSWLNGEQVLDYSGPLGSNNSKECFVKFGIYRGIRKTWDGISDITTDPSVLRVRETLSVRYANLRFGYEDLSHLAGTPDSVPQWEPWPSQPSD